MKIFEKDLGELEEWTAELAARNRQLARLTSELTLAEQRERKRIAEILHDHLQQLLAGARLHLEILLEKLVWRIRRPAKPHLI
ncbi:MAG: hypothetical protein U5K27_04945 [Desulfotignum sp.]|nr:hypothetical protein [Desulfotignum sp.]